ncbi:MAG: ISNCY family transposase [Wenzhouxiangellaceae bacterium]
MRRTELLQEIRKMRFEEAYTGWTEKRLTQEEAARLLGLCERTFRRYIDRYEEEGLDGLIDKRLSQVSHRKAPVDEVLRLEALYKERYDGWNIKHFYSFYRDRHGGTRSYTWVRNTLQKAGLVKKAPARGKHRRRRERAPMVGMMLHQDGSTHEWVPGHYWDLIITFDDATSEHYSMFFVEEEGTASSFQAMREVITDHGLPSSLYTDRGSHYWHTPKAGGKVDKSNLTQFGRAMAQLGVEMIPGYSPEARGRCERQFATHQGRLPKELAAQGITTMAAANRYLREHYLPAFNREFCVKPAVEGSAFVPFIGPGLDDILCEQYERTVNKDNCVSFEGLKLQIPADRYRRHYVKAKVRVHRYPDRSLAIFHGPRRLASYTPEGLPFEPLEPIDQAPANVRCQV